MIIFLKSTYNCGIFFRLHSNTLRKTFMTNHNHIQIHSNTFTYIKIVPGYGGDFNLWGLVDEREFSLGINSNGERKKYKVLEVGGGENSG